MCYHMVHIGPGCEGFIMQEFTFSVTYLTVTITVNILSNYDIHLYLMANVFNNPEYVLKHITLF